MAIVLDGNNLTTTGMINSFTAVNSTSGTSIDFTGIPAGVKRVTVMFNGVSTSGTSNYQIQIGSGSITSSGYKSQVAFGGSGSVAISTSAFLINNNIAAAYNHSGIITLATLGANVWAESGTLLPDSTGNVGCFSGGSVTLSGSLDRVRITTANGTDTFDAGSINVLYE